MMDSYGAMAIGQDYQEYKGYHDAEMWQYAEKRVENLWRRFVSATKC